MKRKYLAIGLLALGVCLLCASLILTALATADTEMIGGADLPTFWFMFFRARGGAHGGLALLGVSFCIASAVAGWGEKGE